MHPGEDAAAQAGSLTRDGTARDAPAGASRVAVSIAAGRSHSCTVARRGVKCWGLNQSGQLSAPALRRPIQVVAGVAHTCALDADGVKCWGSNNLMQSTVPALRNPRQISAGSVHTCALDADGVKCWGSNGTMQSAVPATLHNPTQVAAGGSHTCVLDADGVKCWGLSGSGQITVPALRQPTQVAVGDRHSCAIDADGVKCWGLNTAMQTTVPALRDPIQVTGGASHTCALDADGVKCWGSNALMQTMVPDLRRPTQVTAGLNHTCALDADGVKCWGNNTNGEISLPADLDLVGHHGCVIGNGGLRCAGDNEHGQLGVGNDQDRVVALTAAPVSDLGQAFGAPAQIVVGVGFGCALGGDGAVKCWGANARGQLGLGDDRDRGLGQGEMGDALTAISFSGAAPMTKIGVGQDHACALGRRGEVFCWGKGDAGQLGTEATDDVGLSGGPTQPRLKAGIVVKGVALGRAHTCILGEDGAVYCFGDNDSGQLGLGRAGSIGGRPGTMGEAMQPVALADDFHAKAIASGSDHVCALADDGRVKCWGDNARGQLGVGDTRDRGTSPSDLGAALPPVALGHGQFVVDLTCGNRHCCARMIQNTMKCWGDNDEGQLGLGDVMPRGGDASSTGDDLPFILTPPHERVLSLEAVSDRTCARTDSGLRCWGRNRSGELGYGDRERRGGSPATIPRALSPLGI